MLWMLTLTLTLSAGSWQLSKRPTNLLVYVPSVCLSAFHGADVQWDLSNHTGSVGDCLLCGVFLQWSLIKLMQNPTCSSPSSPLRIPAPQDKLMQDACIHLITVQWGDKEHDICGKPGASGTFKVG